MQSIIPDDENGAVLKRMQDGGDALTEPRTIDFEFIFSSRNQALEFAGMIGEKEYAVRISYFEEKKMWDAQVCRFMVPDHAEIGRIELDLAARARLAGGQPDGWGCQRIVRK